jgi:hypothetical protein
MHKPCLRDTLRSGRPYRLLTVGAFAVLMALAWPSAIASAQSADKKTDLAIRPEFREPIVLTSKDGVLEVRLTARQRRRPRSSAYRKARPGDARHGSDARPEFSSVRLRGHPWHGVQRTEVRRQPLSSAHAPGISRRTADRPFRKRPHRPDHPGLLRSAVHAQGSAGSSLPGADDLVTDKSPHPWRSHQPEGKCR